MADSIIERAAKSHWDAKRYSTSRTWEELPQSERTKAINYMTAAIKAIREPSEAMVSEGWRNYNQGPCVTPIWQAMIDAALAERQS